MLYIVLVLPLYISAFDVPLLNDNVVIVRLKALWRRNQAGLLCQELNGVIVPAPATVGSQPGPTSRWFIPFEIPTTSVKYIISPSSFYVNVLCSFIDLIDRVVHTGILLPNKTWKSHIYNGPAATLHYRVRLVCDEHYYGASCTVYCRPRDDRHGHNKCDSNGNRICLSGWSGPYCNIGKYAF